MSQKRGHSRRVFLACNLEGCSLLRQSTTLSFRIAADPDMIELARSSPTSTVFKTTWTLCSPERRALMPPPYNLEGCSFNLEKQEEGKDVWEEDEEDELKQQRH